MLRTILLAGSSAFAMLATSATATAATFTYTGGVETWTVPTTALYDISLAGGQGGGGTYYDNPGGEAATVSGDLVLYRGQIVDIAVGAASPLSHINYAGAGGGGTFVFFSSASTPIAVAGGGGGCPWEGLYCGPGRVGPAGGGYGGADGGGGGGWRGAGGDGGLNQFVIKSSTGGSGPPSFAGGAGAYGRFYGDGDSGGFGGGGGAGYNGGGGGGGYTGGDAGFGGTSFLATGFSNTVEEAGANSGDGYVIITEIAAVPEPSSWSYMLTGLGFLGYVLRRNVLRSSAPSRRLKQKSA